VFAQVVVDIAHSAVGRPYTYAVPDHLCVEAGQRVLVPFGAGNRATEGFVVSLTAACDTPCKEILRALDPYPAIHADQLALALWIAETYRCLHLDALRLMVPPLLRGTDNKVKHEKFLCLTAGVDADASEIGLRSPVQREILRFAAGRGQAFPKKELLDFLPDCNSALAALLKKGILREDARELYRDPIGDRAATTAPSLTAAQREAVRIVCEELRSGETALLHGVTGSGKTEVYLACIDDCLQRGQTAIVLVPEIALTPQTVARFCGRFGTRVAVLHSRLSPGERFDEWRRIRAGTARVIVGARSAVFAPARNLGLIVMDEEHETSYQSEKSPRYHALEVARQRVQICGARLLLGSATPSLTTYSRAVIAKNYRLLRLDERVVALSMPEVYVADMRAELAAGNTSVFSRALADALTETLGRGEQAMLFLNRRGYATFVSCRACGAVLTCPNCDVSLTHHKLENRMRCHYCNANAPLPSRCPSCNSPHLKSFGVGTQQVQEQFEKQFPQIAVARMDSDTVTEKGAYERVLGDFRDGKTQLLIGTQMIAKGHDFPNVTLVGVVAADTTLNLPNYLSRERTFQLLTQVAGRSGRQNLPGRVIVQTYNPQHPVIGFAQAQDYEAFFHYEMMERRKCCLPPFSVFVRLLFTGEDAMKLSALCTDFAMELEKKLLAVLGESGAPALLHLSAAPAPVARIAGKCRQQVLIKLLRTKQLRDALYCIYAACDALDARLRPNLEVNPTEMY